LNRSIVLGLGNCVNRDSGLGIHAVRAMAAHLGPAAGVELVDGSLIGLDIPHLVEQCEHLLLIDAIDDEQVPGMLIERRGAEIVPYAGGMCAPYQMIVQDVLARATLHGRLPAYLHMIGVQPADMTRGWELSPRVAASLPAVLFRARILLTGWGMLTPCDWNA